MKVKIFSPLVLVLILFTACDKRIAVTEQNILGMWVYVDSKNSSRDELDGILISKMDTGLYQENITIPILKSDISYSPATDGCFINLKERLENSKSVHYLCLGGEHEETIYRTKRMLVIGGRRYKKFNPS